jgi:hypothetical protein
MPLTNEVVIPRKDGQVQQIPKPTDDAQFSTTVTKPGLPGSSGDLRRKAPPSRATSSRSPDRHPRLNTGNVPARRCCAWRLPSRAAEQPLASSAVTRTALNGRRCRRRRGHLLQVVGRAGRLPERSLVTGERERRPFESVFPIGLPNSGSISEQRRAVRQPDAGRQTGPRAVGPAAGSRMTLNLSAAEDPDSPLPPAGAAGVGYCGWERRAVYILLRRRHRGAPPASGSTF